MAVGHIKFREKKNQNNAAIQKERNLYANPGKKCGGLWWTYLVSLIFKTVIDAGFLYILYNIYEGCDLPALTKCSLEPCPNVVDCYLSRPTEKKIFTIFMVASSVLCILMCIIEMIYLVCKRCNKVLHEHIEQHELRALSRPRSECRKDPTARATHSLSKVIKDMAAIEIS